MSAMKRGRRDALVLLIVLGMLSLLSLLAVTYVVFAGQSRTASIAMARRDFRETPPDRLIDQAFRQVLRGTTDPMSVAWKNDILGDLYGSGTSPDAPIFLTARVVSKGVAMRDNPYRMANYTYPAYNNTSTEGPQLFGNNQFLKIPLFWPDVTTTALSDVHLPEQSDAWNGRVVTFLAGPLAGQSVRIVRYVGEVPIVPGGGGGGATLDPARGDLQYSITVDLTDLKETVTTVGFTSGGSMTRTTSEWIAQGAHALLYEDTTNLLRPYSFMVNSGALNAHGAGIDINGNANFATYSGMLANSIRDAYLANRAYARRINGSYVPDGDTDEPYDAADYQNFFLALKQHAITSGTPSEPSDDVIPSFHRPAVINHLMKFAPNLGGITPTDPAEQLRFKQFLDAVQRATGRPLSYNIKFFPGGLVSNPGFTGSNSLDFRNNSGTRSPQLVIDWSKLPNANEQLKFEAWLRWLTRGPWDVDNDGEGTGDSVWVDLNFPLMTSPEGKLLKLLTAFYIEDMDGRLDLNVDGNNSTATAVQTMQSNKYAYKQNTSAPAQWPQGIGYGPAEISLRPLFANDTEYAALLSARYGVSGDSQPGKPNENEDRSKNLERNRQDDPLSTLNNGLGYPRSTFPLIVRGKAGFGLDLLGNPILISSVPNNTVNPAITLAETLDDPYESSVLFGNRFDRGFSFAEYQRLARLNDVDRTGAPRRLYATAPTSFNPAAAEYWARLRSMSPRSVSLNLPRFGLEYEYPRADKNNAVTRVTRRVASFVEFVEAYAQQKKPALISPSPLYPTPPTLPAPYFNNAALTRLFPIEFMQNLPLNLNRPLGNGVDEDSDGMIDEADELLLGAGQTSVYYNGVKSTSEVDEYVRDLFYCDYFLETDADTTVVSRYGGNQPKQLLARHLYCLAQLILPAQYRFPNQPDPTTVVSAAERARVLAQWAVNVVDFRDPDSAMTRFAYDSTPFEPKPGGGGTPVYWLPDDGVVWGVEQTDLVMTETLAFHDLRIRNQPNSQATPPDTEQLRIPEGSLFMEFYCPRVTTPMLDPTETTSTTTIGIQGLQPFDGTLHPSLAGLYVLENNELKLDLGATSSASAGKVSPVWRVAFLKPELKPGTNTNEHQDPFSQVYENTDASKRFRYSYQIPIDSDPAATTAAGLKWMLATDSPAIAAPKIDRIMWFANLDPTTVNAGLPTGLTTDSVFRWTDGYNRVRGGQYLVVGPRKTTYLGSKVQTGPPAHMPSNHRFEFTNNWNWLHVWNQNNEPAMWAEPNKNSTKTMPIAAVPLPKVANNADIDPKLNAGFSSRVRDCVCMTAGMPVPDAWPKPTADPDFKITHIGLNVSEPTRDNYYDVPEYILNSNDTTNPSDTENNAVSYKTLGKDAYIDWSSGKGTGTSRPPFDKTKYLGTSGWDDPANMKAYPEIKTERNWTAAVLQRLADPQRPYDAKYNPYITVDWMSIDLTVFSGEETLQEDKPVYFASRHKTGAMLQPSQAFQPANINTTAPLAGNTFYSYHSELKDKPSTVVSPTTPVHFSFELQSEYNAKVGAVALPRSGTAEFSTLGYLNPQFVIRGTAAAQTPSVTGSDDYLYDWYYLGAPGPNPWAVQQSPTGDVVLKAPLAPYHANRDFASPYELTSVPLSSPGQFFQDFSVQPNAPVSPNPPVPVFNYTLDFEDLYLPSVAPPAVPATGQERSSAILFECVDVPSPWVDSWKTVDPQVVNSGGNAVQTALFENYRAPYNQIPTFREPGKINLNTVTEPLVFRGLMWNIMTPISDRALTTSTTPFEDNFRLERRGFTLPGVSSISDPNPHLHQDSPTEFGRLFTSGLTPDKFPDVAQKAMRSSDVGLLRRRPLANWMRLFDVAEKGVFPDSTTGVKPAGWQYNTSIPLNSFVHNYPASRMANLTTDRSNVFAIRMTIAYFEYDPANGLSVEYGADQGRSKRHRAYYIIDRSIPVGYQTGYDMNVDDCVLLRSMIE